MLQDILFYLIPLLGFLDILKYLVIVVWWKRSLRLMGSDGIHFLVSLEYEWASIVFLTLLLRKLESPLLIFHVVVERLWFGLHHRFLSCGFQGWWVDYISDSFSSDLDLTFANFLFLQLFWVLITESINWGWSSTMNAIFFLAFLLSVEYLLVIAFLKHFSPLETHLFLIIEALLHCL